jgi:hypothetical protein
MKKKEEIKRVEKSTQRKERRIIPRVNTLAEVIDKGTLVNSDIRVSILLPWV